MLFLPAYTMAAHVGAALLEELSISLCVLHQLHVWDGEQDRVIFAVVNHQDMFQAIITASVAVNHIMETYIVPIVHNDGHVAVFLIRQPSLPDVDRFYGRSRHWIREEIFFGRILRRVHAIGRDVLPNTV